MYTKSGVNKKTEELFLEAVPTKIQDKDLLTKLGHIYLKLNFYTMDRDRYYEIDEDDNFTYNEETGINNYDDKEFNFKFVLLSDITKSNELKEELESDKRFHKCHGSAIGTCLNDDEDSMKILIGYTPCVDEEELHSVVETKGEKEDLIIDYTQNVIMKKEDYININKFRVVNEITSKELKEDCNIITEFGIVSPLYLAFRDEIMKDINKNKKVLKLKD